MNRGSGQQHTLGGQKIDFQRHVGVVQRAAVRRRELEARFFPGRNERRHARADRGIADAHLAGHDALVGQIKGGLLLRQGELGDQ